MTACPSAKIFRGRKAGGTLALSHPKSLHLCDDAGTWLSRQGTLTARVRETFPETRTSMVGRSWDPGYREVVRQAGVIGLCGGDERAQRVADRLAEYSSAGNEALLLARLEREHHEMRAEMRVTGYLSACFSKAHSSWSVVEPAILSHTTFRDLPPASVTKPEKNHSKAVQARSLA